MRKILSIDGGGIRGLICAIILQHIETKTNKRVADMFDLVAGTSTGGILSLLLTRGDVSYSALEAGKLYTEHAKEIFPKSPWFTAMIDGEWYSHIPLEIVLYKYFDNCRMEDSKTNVMVSAYDIEKRSLVVIKSWDDKFKEVEMRWAARATSAAPTYFEPTRLLYGGGLNTLVDGGVSINNPAASAYAEAIRLWPEEEDFVVVSLGTGEATRPLYYSDVKDQMMAKWLKPLFSILFDGMADAVDYQMRQILKDKYYRFQCQLTLANDDMDDVTRRNMEALDQEAYKIIYDNDKPIEELCSILMGI